MRKIFVLIVLMSLAVSSKAAFNGFIPDAPSLEAMIYHHKVMAAELNLRKVEETVNDSLHGESKTQTGVFRMTSDELDKLYRNFDIINTVIQGAYAGVHTYTTYRDIKKYLDLYKKLIEDYDSKLFRKGYFWNTDVPKIVGNTTDIVKELSQGTSDIYNGYMKLAAMLTTNEAIDKITGTKIECTTANIISILDQINGTLDNMRSEIYKHYSDLYLYLAVRLGYYSKRVYNAKDLNDILHDAFDRWSNVAIGQIVYPHRNLGYGGLMGHEKDILEGSDDDDEGD